MSCKARRQQQRGKGPNQTKNQTKKYWDENHRVGPRGHEAPSIQKSDENELALHVSAKKCIFCTRYTQKTQFARPPDGCSAPRPSCPKLCTRHQSHLPNSQDFQHHADLQRGETERFVGQHIFEIMSCRWSFKKFDVSLMNEPSRREGPLSFFFSSLFFAPLFSGGRAPLTPHYDSCSLS